MILYLALIVDLSMIFAYNSFKLLTGIKMNVTECFVSASIDELMKTVPLNQWTTQKLYDIMQKNCPGEYTIENDIPDGIGYRMQFNSDKDAAWFLLQYRTDN